VTIARDLWERFFGWTGIGTSQCDCLHATGDRYRPIYRYCSRNRFHVGPHRDHDGREWRPFQSGDPQ
jgi:hypothetical protein